MHRTNKAIDQGVPVGNGEEDLFCLYFRKSCLHFFPTATERIIDSCSTTKPSVPKRKPFTTAKNILCSSNKDSTNLNSNKEPPNLTSNIMGVSTASKPKTPKTKTKRLSATFTANPLKKSPTPSNSNKRKTIAVKFANRKSIAVGSTKSFTEPKDKFQCNFTGCDMTFFYKTSLATHQKSHETINTCRYCQRSFALSAALSKHLRENCTKIPISERKKLLENDEKSTDSNRTSNKTQRTPKLRKSIDELQQLVYQSCSPSEIEKLKEVVPTKLFPPIKGIRITPRKLIKCFNCGDKFKEPVSYATHAGHCGRENGEPDDENHV